MDKRGEILLKCDEKGDSVISDGDGNIIAYDGAAQPIFNAMDENGRQMCLELLEYMAKNEVLCVNTVGDKRFYYKGVFISSEELFENFL